jgi:glycerol-3-phosphate dehydrogenase
MKNYDVLIVGGGIVGSGLIREMAGHGLSTLLVEKDDFSSQTSARSSKLLHGGIRYLENFDFELVFEALKEKKLWLKIAPHLARSQRFLLPVYKNSARRPIEIKTGISLYDLLAKDPFRTPKWFNKSQVQNLVPFLKSNDLYGCGSYMDAIMDDRKFGLDLIFESLEMPYIQARNHVAFENYQKKNGYYLSTLKDQLTGEVSEVKSRYILFTAGPFTDNVMKLTNKSWQDVILASRGSHIWIKNQLQLKDAIVMTPNDNRIIFIIPRENNKLLIGTTETLHQGEMANIKPTDKDIEYLITNFNEYFPNSPIDKTNILGSYSGVRPLIREGQGSLGKTARTHQIYQPARQVFAIAGGKYTTFRIMAQDLAKLVFDREGIHYDESHSMQPLKRKSQFYSFDSNNFHPEQIKAVIQNECVRTQSDLDNRIGVSDYFFKGEIQPKLEAIR